MVAVGSANDHPESVKAAVDQLLPTLIPSNADLKAFNAAFLSAHSSSPSHILGAARGIAELDATRPLPAESLKDFQTTLQRLAAEDTPTSVPVMSSAIQLLRDLGAPSADIDAFRETCHKRVPLATVFVSEEEASRRRKEAVEGDVLANGVKADL